MRNHAADTLADSISSCFLAAVVMSYDTLACVPSLLSCSRLHSRVTGPRARPLRSTWASATR